MNMYIYLNERYIHTPYNLVQAGPQGLGAPFCKYRKGCPRCTSYKMEEPRVHRHKLLLPLRYPSLQQKLHVYIYMYIHIYDTYIILQMTMLLVVA